MFFIAFGLLQLASHSASARTALRSLTVAAVLALALIAIDVARWGGLLQAEALYYLFHAADYHWFALPPVEQTPMGAWNRTPTQALASAGLPITIAQWVGFALWLLFVVITVWRARGVPLSFPLAFALAFVLLYWGRPVLWTLIYLDLVVVVVVWPTLQRWQKAVLLCAVIALIVSHWWALALTLGGYGLPLLTLQRADFPWETWLVIPLSWLLLLRAMALLPDRDSTPIEEPVPGSCRPALVGRSASGEWQ
jgi:hypothetical protein